MNHLSRFNFPSVEEIYPSWFEHLGEPSNSAFLLSGNTPCFKSLPLFRPWWRIRPDGTWLMCVANSIYLAVDRVVDLPEFRTAAAHSGSLWITQFIRASNIAISPSAYLRNRVAPISQVIIASRFAYIWFVNLLQVSDRRPTPLRHYFYVLNTASNPAISSASYRNQLYHQQCTFVSYVERDTISILWSSFCYSAAFHYAHPAGTVSIAAFWLNTKYY